MFNSSISAFANKENDILLIGELLIDEIRDDSGTLFSTFGGSPSNIAINLKQLGFMPLLVSAVGNDSKGNFLLNTLEHYKVGTEMIQRAKMKTTRVELTRSKEVPVPIFHRTSDYHIELNETLIEALKKSKILHISYWPLTKEPSKSTVLKLVELAKSENLLVAFDPNIHVDLKSSESISHEELLSLLTNVDIVKPSLDDSARLFGEGYTKEEYMSFFEATGVSLILMTLGKHGVFVSYKGKRKLYSVKEIEVLDATGAGDGFWSGFYAALLKSKSLDDAISFAQSISARVLMSIGAITDLTMLNNLD